MDNTMKAHETANEQAAVLASVKKYWFVAKLSLQWAHGSADIPEFNGRLDAPRFLEAVQCTHQAFSAFARISAITSKTELPTPDSSDEVGVPLAASRKIAGRVAEPAKQTKHSANIAAPRSKWFIPLLYTFNHISNSMREQVGKLIKLVLL